MKEKYSRTTVALSATLKNHFSGQSPAGAFNLKNRFVLLVAFLLLGLLQSFGQTLISPTGDGGFETGTTFAANGWTVVNHPTNTNRVWYAGTGQTGYTGNRCAFIGNSTTTVGTNTASRTVHLYRSITVPAGATNIVLSFKYKQATADYSAPTYYDYIAVYTSTTAPTNGNLPSGGALQFGPYPNAAVASFTTQTVTLPNTLAGTTTNLIFTFKADTVAPDGYGAVDDISLTYTPGTTPALSAGTISGNFNNVCLNTDSTVRNFTLSGTNLTTADVVVGALTGYTYSATSGGTYTSTLSFTPSAGSLSQTVYVKLTPTAVQSYSGSIPVSGGGATATSVAVTGSGVNSAPTLTANGTAGSITNTGATITGSTISSNGCTALTGYGIVYSLTNNFSPASGTPVSSSNLASGTFSTTLTGLTAGIQYYYRAFATNSAGTTYYTSQSTFTTESVTPVTWTEGFATTTLPTGWTNTSSWTINNTSSYGVQGNGSNCIYKNLWSSATTANFRTINVGPLGTNDRFKIDSKTVNYSSDTSAGTAPGIGSGNFVIDVSADYGATWVTLATVANTASSAWQTGIYSLAAYSGQNVKIRITGNWISGDYYLALDNFVVEPTPSCAAPTGLGAGSITATTATISWTANSPAPANGYEYYYSNSSTTPVDPAPQVTTTNNSAGLINLTPNTTYYFWVRSLCGTPAASEWSPAGTFTTPCAAITTLPHTESFDGAALPSCWSTSGTGTWSATDYNDGVPEPHTGAGFAGFEWTGSQIIGFLASPAYDFTAGGTIPTPPSVSIDVWVYRSESSVANDKITFYANNQLNTTGAQQLINVPHLITQAPTVTEAGWYLYSAVVPQAFVNGGTFYIIARGQVQGSTSAYSVGFDDYKLYLTPACPAVTSGFAASSITATTATIGWTAPASAPSGGYEYYYSDTNTAPSEAAAVVPANVVSATSAPLTSLNVSTTYYWWVRALCDTSGNGEWSAGGSFTTSQIPATLDFSEGFEATNNWSLVNGTQVNKWVVGGATNNGGSKSLYISNDDGVTNAYDVSAITVAHAYRDIAVPAGTTTLLFSFDWKSYGEIDTFWEEYYDYLTVWMVPTSYSPTAGTPISAGSGNIQVGTYFANQAAFTTYINSALDASSFAGGTMRLVFEWTNDDVAGDQPAAAIDNILIKVPCGATVTSATGASRCGAGSLTLSTVGSAGNTKFRWYDRVTGGTLVHEADAVVAGSTTTASWSIPSLASTTTYYMAAYNGTCESDFRTPVKAEITAVPDIAISGTVSPVGADACTLDHVQLNVTGNNSLPVFSEAFEASVAGALGFNIAVSNGGSGKTYLEDYHTTGNYAISLFGAGDIDAASGNIRLVQRTAIDLTKFTTATLTFDHIAAIEPTFDLGLVEYSTDGGSNWNNFPTTSYTGSATLIGGNVSFDASSYTSWDTQFETEFTPGVAPATSLFKSESINLAAYLTNTSFKVRFRMTYDDSVDYYGWIIDNLKINGIPLVTWSPATGLYTDAALTTPYVSGNAPTVYAAPGGLVTYTAAATTGSCPVTVSQAVENYNKRFVGSGNDWSASVSTDWLPAGVPTVADCVTIPSGKFVTVTTGTAYANNLTVANGATLTVSSGATLRVEGAINSNLTTANLTVDDNGAILQAPAATTNDNTGKIVFHKNSNPLFRLDYTLWSAPITGQTLRAFSLGTSNNRFYVYDYTTPAGSSVYDEAYWPVDPITTYFEEGKGYLIRMPNAITSSVTGTTGTGTTTVAEYASGSGNYIFDGAFAGKPNNGSYSPGLIQTAGASGYNAVGNPYPSPISVSAFLGANSGNLVSNTGIWFWRKKNGSETSYLTLNLSGLVIPPGDTNGNGTELNTALSGFYSGDNSGDTWLIAPGQGFIVQAQTTAATISFTNLMRRATPGAQAFFRQAAGTSSRYWLNMVATNGTGSQALVAYRDDATMGIDYGYDSKVFNTADLSLYSTAADDKLTIQARPGFEVSDVVPMGFTAPAAGQYTISIDHMDGVFADGQAIYLKDLQEGIIRNLSENDYTFTSEAGTFEGRFEVHYQTSALGTTPILDANSVIVFKQGNTISINTGSAMMNSVKVFDVRGRQLYSQGGINAVETVVNNLNVQQQVLIVEIATEKGTVSKRIVF